MIGKRSRARCGNTFPAGAPDETAPEDMDIEDWEIKIYQAVVRREKKSSIYPDRKDTGGHGGAVSSAGRRLRP